MRSSVACLPKGILTSLSLTQDRLLVKAGVLYGQPVQLCGGGVACWAFWSIRRLATREGLFFWSARPFYSSCPASPVLPLRILDGCGELTAHQFKGLATALGIWSSIRKPPMLERAGIFNLQAATEIPDCHLDAVMARDSHFGLSARAASTGRDVGL